MYEIEKMFYYFSAKVFTHGICIPNDTPIQWMSEHMSYLDNFLHLIIL